MIEVKFTLLDKADANNDGQKLIAKEERYKVVNHIGPFFFKFNVVIFQHTRKLPGL